MSTDENGKGIVSNAVGLITQDELVHAGGYYYVGNSNLYLYRANKQEWIMIPSEFYNVNGSAYAWKIVNSFVYSDNTNTANSVLPVINLKANVIVTGTGTSSDPYIVQ